MAGGGGGAIAQGGTGNIWHSGTYGFVGAKVAKDFIQVQFISDLDEKLHCHLIPVTGERGMPC